MKKKPLPLSHPQPTQTMTQTTTLFLAKRKRRMYRQVLRNKSEVAIVQRKIKTKKKL
jgi:hypothetical protein